MFFSTLKKHLFLFLPALSITLGRFAFIAAVLRRGAQCEVFAQLTQPLAVALARASYRL